MCHLVRHMRARLCCALHHRRRDDLVRQLRVLQDAWLASSSGGPATASSKASGGKAGAGGGGGKPAAAGRFRAAPLAAVGEVRCGSVSLLLDVGQAPTLCRGRAYHDPGLGLLHQAVQDPGPCHSSIRCMPAMFLMCAESVRPFNQCLSGHGSTCLMRPHRDKSPARASRAVHGTRS
jgi:hypothetical protein